MSTQPIVPWTDEMIARLEHFWCHTDLSARKIAAELGTTRDAVSGKTSRLFGAGARPKETYSRPHVGWSQEQMDMLMTMLKAGHSNADIGREVGKSRHSVKNKVLTLGLQHCVRVKRIRPRMNPERAWQPLPDTTPIEVHELSAFKCPWPLWVDGPPYRYCGEVKEPKAWYCECHLGLATKELPNGPALSLHQVGGFASLRQIRLGRSRPY
jgi:hypothetical protein